MKLHAISARNFLSFSTLELNLGPRLTVLTGPNGVGKTNLGRCLDMALAVLARYTGAEAAELLKSYEAAGHRGATAYQVALTMTLDQPWERALVLSFVRAAYACGGFPDGQRRAAATLDAIGRARITEESLAPLWTGTLHIQYDEAMRNPWFAAWQFTYSDRTCHITLVGTNSGQLRAGKADPSIQAETSMNISMALTSTIPGFNVDAPNRDPDDSRLMELANTLPGPGHGLIMNVNPTSDGSALTPLSLRELAASLRVADYHNYHFELSHVMHAILSTQIVLTANRRVPFRRRFALAEFDDIIDIRDGSGVPAELFRLKNGDFAAQRRYKEIEGVFFDLTGRKFVLRSHPAPSHTSTDGLIIEPIVITDNSEYSIEFAGAGAQEALALSALLLGAPGRFIVLDEPAVNAEPTVQRRLTRLIKATGQCMMITHSPDAVPIDQPDDLANIVRLGPTEDGPRPWRAGSLNQRDRARWLKLVEPTHVRALLFASKVILCEGATEVGALRQWWSQANIWGMPTPESVNMPIIDVGGDHGFGGYIEYLEAFGIPWAAIADGPAFRPNSKLAQQLCRLGHQPNEPLDPSADLSMCRSYWAQAGVFTVAEAFGDDGTKSGEFEAFLSRIDIRLLSEVQSDIGTRSKPQVGALFAERHETPPAAITTLYRSVMTHLDSRAASTGSPVSGSSSLRDIREGGNGRVA